VRTGRGAALAALAALVTTALAPAGHTAPWRKHRPHVPPVCSPCQLAVDEDEWFVKLSRIAVSPGAVTLKIYNRGEDDHDLVVRELAGGQPGAELYRVEIKTGEKTATTLDLRRGSYEILCDFFVGTPQSHYDAGMRATLLVA
jgi:hypothetical protein